MKKALLVCVLSASLFSCSLLQRRGGGPEEEDSGVRDTAEAPADGPLFSPTGQEAGASSESEVSRLNTKIAALETKVDVLSASLERMQAMKPAVEAQTAPQAHLAAPMEDVQEIQDETKPVHVSAAPARARPTPPPARSAESAETPPASASGAEKEFRSAMQLFQNGQNLEASSRFALMAKKFPRHLLAGHALYWAGEAAARGQQWGLAIENWADLEKTYPHSAYVPEALAGLAKAHDAQGDATKAKYYRTALFKAFPRSPVAMKAEADTPTASPAKAVARAPQRSAPAADDLEETVPSYEEESPAAEQQ